MTIPKSQVLLSLPFLLPVALLSQEFRASLSGAVSDSQGAAVPAVRITAIETATGVEARTVSDNSGRYSIPFLAPGAYRIEAEAAGFKRYTRESFRLDVGE